MFYGWYRVYLGSESNEGEHLLKLTPTKRRFYLQEIRAATLSESTWETSLSPPGSTFNLHIWNAQYPSLNKFNSIKNAKQLMEYAVFLWKLFWGGFLARPKGKN